MDVIAVRGIRAYGRHGANPGERDAEQAFDVDIEIELDLSAAARSDALGDTIDYATVHDRVSEIVRTRSYALLERLAMEIVGGLFEDARVDRVRVSISKPNLLAGATPAVTLIRSRSASA